MTERPQYMDYLRDDELERYRALGEQIALIKADIRDAMRERVRLQQAALYRRRVADPLVYAQALEAKAAKLRAKAAAAA